MTNADTINALFERNAIAIRRGSLFDREPGPLNDVSIDRLEGMILGLAVGDSLGNTSEGQLPVARGEAFGEIRDYVRSR